MLSAQAAAGLILLFTGFVQSFWGNDPYLGWSISLIAALYLAPSARSVVAKVVASGRRQRLAGVGIFILILWVALGVGELPDKVQMMLASFPETNITGF